jgi:methionyl-tRNA formyltransferase
MANYIIVSEKEWHIDLHLKLQEIFKDDNWKLISKKEDFSKSNLDEFLPNKIFIPHWSHIIPKIVHENYDCVVFHMTDLPYGRGGSPLQNLIVRGHRETKITAIKIDSGIDTGDIYLKKELSLEGTATDIFERATNVIFLMIQQIVNENLTPYPQEGTPVTFPRRTKEMSNLDLLQTETEIFDYIRMLDANGYPNAFIETSFFKFEFTAASIDDQKIITANVRITKK